MGGRSVKGAARSRRRLPVLGAASGGRTRRHPPISRLPAPRPALAVWELTSACDQRCQACGARSGRRRADELSFDEAVQLIAELDALGVGEVALIGGEAYLRSDLVDIVRAIRSTGMSVSMVTGGLNLKRERIEELADVGIKLVSVSIDGQGQTHDQLRTTGGFERAMVVLTSLSAAGIPAGANTQINRRNWRQLPDLIRTLAAAGVQAWQPFLTMAHGNAADRPELVLQPYQLLDVFAALDEALAICRDEDIVVWPGNNLGYFGHSEHELRRRQTDRAHYQGCSAGLTGLGIESNGGIKACPSLGGATNIAGSWREHGLRALWEQAPVMQRNRVRTVEDLWGFCRTCEYATTCMGGCTATTEALFGRSGNNPFCHHRVTTLDQRGLRERLEPIGDADPGPFGHRHFRLVLEAKPAARRRERTRPGLAAMFSAALAACGGRAVTGQGDDDGGPTHAGTTTGETADTTTQTGPHGDSSTDADDCGDDSCSSGFIYGAPDVLPNLVCDPGLQECAEGEKCTAYLYTPGYCCVDSTKCVPVIGDQQLGDVCERTEDNDDCAAGLFCMTKTSGSTGTGVCLAFCDINDPSSCAGAGLPDVDCVAFNGGVLPLCTDPCDPLAPECEEWAGCYGFGQTGFVCNPSGEAGLGEECDVFDSCQPGMACVSEALLATCEHQQCCTPICDLEQGPNDPVCAVPGEQCVPWFETGAEPPGLENVGRCGVE